MGARTLGARRPGDEDCVTVRGELSWVAIGAVGVGLLLAGCGDDKGDSKTVDANKLEQEIENGIPGQTIKVSSVSCPDGEENKADTKFTCKAKLSDGGSAKVAVTVTAPNKFSYNVKSGTVVLAGTSIDKVLEQDLAANGAPNATVNCPAQVPVKPGETVTCPAQGAGGGEATVSFQFTDASGSIDESSVKTEG
jgi:hypothetical protein